MPVSRSGMTLYVQFPSVSCDACHARIEAGPLSTDRLFLVPKPPETERPAFSLNLVPNGFMTGTGLEFEIKDYYDELNKLEGMARGRGWKFLVPRTGEQSSALVYCKACADSIEAQLKQP